jgi:predicted metal-dependent hydrolase
MSKFADSVYKSLKRIFPHFTIVKEHYVSYKNTKLFFDFHIRELNLFFEVQGRQHQEFNKHFHGDREGFVKSKARDNLKKEWIEKYNHHLIEIYPGDKLSYNALLNKIYKELGFKTNVRRKKKKRKYNPKRKPSKGTS